MRSQNTRSGCEGLERSCKGTAAGWLASTEPVEGVEPAQLTEALQVLRGSPGPLPFVGEAVSTNQSLAQAVDNAFRGPLDSLSADSIVVDLAEALLAAELRIDPVDLTGRRAAH